MAATPVRALAVEAALAAGEPAAEAAQLADHGTEPPADINASAGFRHHLARVLTGRVLGEQVGGRHDLGAPAIAVDQRTYAGR
jgi:carbon-monoxide dehydrogenase medium subunit